MWEYSHLPILASSLGKNFFIALVGPINAQKIILNIENILRLNMAGEHGPSLMQGHLWLWVGQCPGTLAQKQSVGPPGHMIPNG